jgi:uncharacterized protein HemX
VPPRGNAPGIPGLQLPPQTVIREPEESPVSTPNPFSIFPVGEAAKTKVPVSILLLLALPAVTYWVGSNRHAEQLAAVKAELRELKKTSEACSTSTRLDELMNNLAREQAAIGGRVQQINGDLSVVYTHITGAQRRQAADQRP